MPDQRAADRLVQPDAGRHQEAANSQTLSTRQSIAMSALARREKSQVTSVDIQKSGFEFRDRSEDVFFCFQTGGGYGQR